MTKNSKAMLWDVLFTICCIFAIIFPVGAAFLVVPVCELIGVPVLAAPLAFIVFTVLMVAFSLFMVWFRSWLLGE